MADNKFRSSLITTLVLGSFAFLPVIPLAAQAAPDAALEEDDNERPTRGVARVSLINGEVNVKRGDSGDWTAAAINAPLVLQDSLFTGPASRAEVQFDSSNMIRVAANSEIRMGDLQPQRYLVQVAKGLVTFRVLRDQQADVEISTPSIAIRPSRRGTYRVEVREDGTTEVSVRSGEAEIFTPQGSERLRAGKTLLARGTTANPEFREVDDTPIDDWDRWNQTRDRDFERSQSYRYVSPDIYGVEDLDNHGRWVDVPQYGSVWTPRVAVGWAPYRTGRWAWIDWYGWTWVSYDPWGWAPYHYGRWFNQPGIGWCWWPGGVRSRHWWRPALVGFFGWDNYGGFRAGVGFGFGRIGWVPLAPFERYRPWYGNRYYGGYRNNTYVNNSVRIVNNVNITNVYRNARHNGVSGADHGDFVGGRGNRIRGFGEADLQRASSIEGRVPMVPDRQSLRVADREVTARGGADRSSGGSGGEQRFFSRRQPAQVERASFDEQRRGMEQVARRTFGGGSGEASREGSRSTVERTGGDDGGRGWRRVGGADGAAARGSDNSGARVGGRSADGNENSNGGWRSLGDSGRRSAGGSDSSGGGNSNGSGREAARGSDNGGWRSFGDPGSSSRGAARDASPDSGRSSRSSDSGSWGRFGDPSSSRSSGSDANGDSGRSGRSSDSGSWRRFEGASSPSRSDGDSGWGRRGGDRSSERSSDVQVSPRIVRERDSNNNSGGGSFDNGNSGGRSSRSSDGWWGGGGGGGRSRGGGDSGSGAAPSWNGGGGGRSSGGDSGGGGRSSGGWSGGGGGGGRSGGGDGGGGGRSSGGGGGGGGGGRSGGGDGGGGGRGGGGGGRQR